MHLVRICVPGPNDAAGVSEPSINVLRINAERVACRLLLKMVEEILLRRKYWAGIPLNRQLTGREYCLVLRLGDDANKILAHHHLHETSNISHRLFVYMGDRRTHFRGPHNAPVQHSRDSDIVNEFELTGHQGGPIQGRDWFAQHLPICSRSPLSRRVQRKIEVLASDKFLVPDVASHRARDYAVRHREILNRLSEFLSSETQKCFPSCGRREREIFRVKVRRS